MTRYEIMYKALYEIVSTGDSTIAAIALSKINHLINNLDDEFFALLSEKEPMVDCKYIVRSYDESYTVAIYKGEYNWAFPYADWHREDVESWKLLGE